MLNGVVRRPDFGSLRHRVLIASDSEESAEAIRGLLNDLGQLSVETRILDGQESDPLRGLAHAPDLLLLRVGASGLSALEALVSYPPAERPILVVIGDVSHHGFMRAAMQAGARDFLTEPVPKRELLATIERLASERRHAPAAERCQLTSFINGKGGSGATFLACNIAQLFAERSALKTVLLGLDMQFGTLPRYLDVHPKRCLLEALEVAGDLDGAAIGAYLSEHASGLQLLASSQEGALLPHDVTAESVEAILELLLGNFEQCVVDLPRRIEPSIAMVLERSDRIVLVLQQSVPSLHDASRMYELLTRELAIPAERVTVAVNRYRRAAEIELPDIQRYFAEGSVVCVANDYRSVTDSINMGVPIYEYARRSPVTSSLIELEQRLGGRADDRSISFFPKLRRTAEERWLKWQSQR